MFCLSLQDITHLLRGQTKVEKPLVTMFFMLEFADVIKSYVVVS